MKQKNPLSRIPRDDLDEALFNSLRSVHKFELAKVAKFGLNYEAIFLLQFLRRHSPAKMSEIAEEMNIPISTATRVVDRVETRGLISRKKDRKDKRIILVSLKPKGEKIVREVENHTFEIILKNLAEFNEDKIKSFIETAIYMEKILRV
ncbi:MAG: MarR family transcriptional regulator [Deltaproteobacteria bacterium]|nr:MarR family transcriptional regulator [Deltaproteobacteria bacterium]